MALVLTGFELVTSRTKSERRIDWANLTAVHYVSFNVGYLAHLAER